MARGLTAQEINAWNRRVKRAGARNIRRRKSNTKNI